MMERAFFVKAAELSQVVRVGKGREGVACIHKILVTSLGVGFVSILVFAFDELVGRSGQGVAVQFRAQLHYEMGLVHIHFLEYLLFVPVSPLEPFLVFQLHLRQEDHP